MAAAMRNNCTTGSNDGPAATGRAGCGLGVVQGNARAERFWESMGYIQVRTREGVAMGKLTNTLRVMVKPLHGQTIEEFLALVPRDRPEPAGSG